MSLKVSTQFDSFYVASIFICQKWMEIEKAEKLEIKILQLFTQVTSCPTQNGVWGDVANKMVSLSRKCVSKLSIYDYKEDALL